MLQFGVEHRREIGRYLEHVPHRSTESMVDKTEVEVTTLFDEGGDSGIVRSKG
jgi:hypothetical protein